MVLPLNFCVKINASLAKSGFICYNIYIVFMAIPHNYCAGLPVQGDVFK